MISMSCAWEAKHGAPRLWLRSGVELQSPSLGLGGAALPLHPIWPRFAINTMFYAAALAALWLLIRGGYCYVFRRALRARRGLCPACAYPMGESDVCSECGSKVPKRAVAQSTASQLS